MKKRRIFAAFGLCFLVMVCLPASVQAQNKINGLYLTAKDFQRNVLTDSATTNRDNRIEQQLEKNLLVYRGGNVRKYKFGTVYGYVQDGTTYRAWRKQKWISGYGFYTVLGECGLTLYSKRSSHHRSNGYVWYYYSLTSTGEIKRLVKKNIQKDFSEHPRFVLAVSGIMDKNKRNLRFDRTGSIVLEYYKAIVDSQVNCK